MIRRGLCVAVLVAGCGGGDAPKDAPTTTATTITVDSAPPTTSASGSATFAFHADGADAFTCQLDTAAAVACTSPYTVSVGDGHHQLTIAAFAAMQPIGTPIIVSWDVDTTPPDTTITSGPASADNSPATMFAFVGVPASDTASFKCSLDGAAFAACVSPDMVSVADGAHTFDVEAIDAAGNVDPSPAHWAWTVDTSTLDTMILSGPLPGTSTQGDVAFTFQATDALATFECEIDAAAYAPCTSPAEFVLAEGMHTFSVRARHGATVDPTPATRTWTVDLTAPDVAFTTTPANPSNAMVPVFAWSSTDATATFACQLNTATFAACTSPTNATPVLGGSNTFRVRATDPAGNSTTATYTWSTDFQAPTIVIDTIPNPSSSTATFGFHASEAVTSFECEIDGVVAYATCTSPWSQLVPGGSLTAHIRATDLAGNVGTIAYSWTVNQTGATVAITSGPTTAMPSNSSAVSFAFTTAGTPTAIECSLDNAAFAACSSPAAYTGLADGDHAFVVRVKDGAGNTNAATRNFTVDTVAPTIAFTSTPPALTSDRTPTFAFTVTGAASGQVRCGIDGTVGPQCSDSITWTPLADGAHAFTVTAYDAANNMAQATFNFTVDTVGPTLNVTATPANPSSTSVATFAFDSPDAVGFECQLDNVAFTACTSPFTTFVSDGTHTVRIHANDAIGNHTTSITTWVTRAQPAVSTSAGAYDTGAGVVVTWRGLPGTPTDYVAYAPVGSSDATVTQMVSTAGAASGMATLPGTTTAGLYVARAFANGSKVAESVDFGIELACPTLTDSGAVSIHNAGDLASLAHYTALGDLTISPAADGLDVTLPCLQQLHSLVINNANGGHAVTGVHMPRLATIATNMTITEGTPVFDAPSLTAIAGALSISQQATFPDLSSLARVTTLGGFSGSTSGTMGANDFPGVTSIGNLNFLYGIVNGFNSVTSVGALTITAGGIAGLNGLVHATSISASALKGQDGTLTGLRALTTVDNDATFEIDGGPALASLPALQTVGGSLTISVGTVQTLSLPSLRSVGQTFTLQGAPSVPSTLSKLDAPLLLKVYYQLVVHTLPQFPLCAFQALLAQLYPQPLFNSQSGLNATGTCN